MESKHKINSSNSTITSESLAKTIAEEGNFEKLIGSAKSLSHSLCDVDKLTPEELQDCLKRAKENPTQPFTFLTKIPDEEEAEATALLKAQSQSTDIDAKLAYLIKRVELNKNLLERTNQRVKDIDLLVKQTESILPKNQLYDEELFMDMKASGNMEPTKTIPKMEYPEIEEFRRTMNDTKEMLDYVKKISKEEMTLEDLPPHLLAHMGLSANEVNNTNDEKSKFTKEPAMEPTTRCVS